MDDKTLNVIKGAQAADIQDEGLNKYFNEMNKIRKKGRVDTNKIKVVEMTDHKNISLMEPKDGQAG